MSKDQPPKPPGPKGLKAQLEELRKKAVREQAGEWSPADDVLRAIKKKSVTAAPPRAPSPARPAPVRYRRDLPRAAPAPYRPEPDRHVVLNEAVDGVEAAHLERGPSFTVTRRVSQVEGFEAMAGALHERLAVADAAEGVGLCRRITDLGVPAAPEHMLFVDIETTGLDNTPLFLIGAMLWHADGLEVRQYLARNYAEEAAVIACFRDVCASKLLLVTFNGKSFDMPFIRLRATATGVALPEYPAHLDLLHECRRVWRHALPNCKLQTLERYICDRRRSGDIPGDQIAEAYHAYVRTDNAWQIVDILEHNLLDLITMADLMTRLP